MVKKKIVVQNKIAAKKKAAKKKAVKKPAMKVVKKAVKSPVLTPEMELRRMEEILRILKREYSEAKCSLDFKNPFELLVATILSAQCTDERVNKVTPALFAQYPTPPAMAAAKLKDIEKMVQSTGFFRNKSLSIKGTSEMIMKVHAGQVPRTLDELVELPGVGRKTANVLLGNAFDTPGLVVDTHVGRLCRRMGFTEHLDAVKVEHEMMEFVPREDWTLFSHLLIYHGRAICLSRRAFCEKCPVAKFCPKVGVVLRDSLAAEDSG